MDKHSQESSIERRQFWRQSVNYDALVVASTGNNSTDFQKAKILNISKEGLCLESEFEAGQGTLLSISILISGNDSLILAEVMWARKTSQKYIYGLKIKRWTYIDPLLQNKINQKNPSPRIPFLDSAPGLTLSHAL